MDKNNILEEKEAIAQKLSKVGKYFVKGAKIGALSAALVMGNVMTTGCSTSTGGGNEIIVPQPNPGPNPTPSTEVTLDVTRCNTGYTYGLYEFGKNAALIAGNDEATLAKRGKMNFDEVTTIMNRDINDFKSAVADNVKAVNLFNGLQNNLKLFKEPGTDSVDSKITANTTAMGKLLEPIFRKMDNITMVSKANACFLALSMRSYVKSAGNETNATQVAADIDQIKTALSSHGLNYDDMTAIEAAMTACLEAASTNAGINDVTILQKAVNLAISKDGVWGLRDKVGDTAMISTNPSAYNYSWEMRTNLAVRAAMENIYRGISYLPKKLQKFNAFQIQNEISTERLV